MATPDIIFYTAKLCPYAQRVELAFQEAKADVTRYQIDLLNKPEWYASRVNPASKVPAVVCGSSKSDPENPPPESARITESLVLLEFVADLYPDSGLLPKDPVERARVRFFIDAVSTKVFPPFGAFFFRGESPDPFIAAVAEIQELLPPAGQFVVGDHFTIADAAIAPFIGRWELNLRNDIGKFAEGTGPRVYQELFQSERFARLQKYFANISSRESFKNSFDSEYLLAIAKKRLGRQ
ncbi:glutathione S-transferase [Lactarius psammicola]|nr:glutathione S-transferase [Lactarius psammicola]